MQVHMRTFRPLAAVAVALTALVAVVMTPAVSQALPTAGFTFAPAAPTVGEPVAFTFTGSCDVPPCRIQWRWFRPGGSSLGVTMGEGERISYTFRTAGAYSVVAKITNSTVTHGSDSATQVVSVKEVPDVVEEVYQDTDRRVRLSGWRGVASAAATGGGYRVGTGSLMVPFAGTSVRYTAVTGPDLGIARVRVDGVVVRTVDLYSATPGFRSRTVTGLGRGSHTLDVRRTGGRNAASTGTAVSLDEIVFGTSHIDDVAQRVRYGGWTGRANVNADGGSVRVASTVNQSAGLTFGGTSLTWETATGPNQGIARVVIDGREMGTFDNWSPTATTKVTRTFAGLTPGQHTASVAVLGTKRAASTGTQVALDAFVVR
jgi:hypothetical protein